MSTVDGPSQVTRLCPPRHLTVQKKNNRAPPKIFVHLKLRLTHGAPPLILSRSPRCTAPMVYRHSRKAGPQDLSTMGRDKRCALYEGELRHTLGTTDTHEMYLEPFNSRFLQATSPSIPTHIVPYKIPKRFSVMGETVHGKHVLSQAVGSHTASMGNTLWPHSHWRRERAPHPLHRPCRPPGRNQK